MAKTLLTLLILTLLVGLALLLHLGSADDGTEAFVARVLEAMDAGPPEAVQALASPRFSEQRPQAQLARWLRLRRELLGPYLGAFEVVPPAGGTASARYGDADDTQEVQVRARYERGELATRLRLVPMDGSWRLLAVHASIPEHLFEKTREALLFDTARNAVTLWERGEAADVDLVVSKDHQGRTALSVAQEWGREVLEATGGLAARGSPSIEGTDANRHCVRVPLTFEDGREGQADVLLVWDGIEWQLLGLRAGFPES